MASVNKVILMGNLGKDPELRFLPNGDAVCNFSIATTYNWKDKAGEKQERTEWHKIVMYQKLAENAGEYLKKGHPVFIEGRLQTRKWQTKEGQDRYTTEIIAESMQMLGGRDSASSGASTEKPAATASGSADEFNQAPQRTSDAAAPNAPATNFDDFEDDIPF